MGTQTDRQTGKSSRWAFTAYEEQWCLFTIMPPLVAEWGWQTEKCPDTQREHYQGYIRTTRQVRFKQLKDLFPKVHLEVAIEWAALLNYCKKSDTAVPGTQVHQTNTHTPLTMNGMLMKLAAYVPIRQPIYEKLEDKEYMKNYKHSLYWDTIEALTEDYPEDIGLATNAQIHKVFLEMYNVYIRRLPEEVPEESERQTDRQTGYAFEE